LVRLHSNIYISLKRGYLLYMSNRLAQVLGGSWRQQGRHPVMAHLWIASRNGNLRLVEEVMSSLREHPPTRRESVLNFVWGCGMHGVECTPLFIAAFQGHVEVVKCLIEYGADLHKSGTAGCTPLHIAAYMGHVGVVQCLLDAHVDVAYGDASGCTALHSAARTGQCAVILMLVEHGADVFACDVYGISPITYARVTEHESALHVLLANSAG
jgi:hypothetical protein